MKDLIEQYYRDNFKKLVKAYNRRCGSEDVAEDVIQEAFALALQYKESYNPKYNNFKAWFDRIVLNCFRKRLKEDRMMGMTDEIDEEAIEMEPLQLDRLIFAEQMVEHMSKKPTHIAEVLDLYFVKGYGHTSISDVTGIPRKSVESNVFRFQQEMRQLYGQEAGVR